VIVNEPLSVELGNAQAVLFMVRLKLLVPRDPSACTVKFVMKAKSFANVVFDSVADHMPLILPVACELDPQPERIMLTLNKTTATVFLMGENSSRFSRTAKWHL